MGNEQRSIDLFLWKNGSGKTTKSREIAQKWDCVLLSEDEWLESIYPNKINSLDEYIIYSGQLKPQMKKLVQSILVAGAEVLMDFSANAIHQREWFRGIYSEIQVPHNLNYIDLQN